MEGACVIRAGRRSETRFGRREQSFQRAYRWFHGALLNALMNARARALMDRPQQRPRTRPHERPHGSMRAGATQARGGGAMPALMNALTNGL